MKTFDRVSKLIDPRPAFSLESAEQDIEQEAIGNTFDRPTSKIVLSPMLHRNEAIRVQPLPHNRLSLPKMELNVELGLELPCKTHLRMVRYASEDGFVFTPKITIIIYRAVPSSLS